MMTALMLMVLAEPPLSPDMQKIHDDPKLQAKLCAALAGEGKLETPPIATFASDDPARDSIRRLVPGDDWHSDVLLDGREEALVREAYRVTLASFAGHMTVRVNVHNDKGALVAKMWPTTPRLTPLCRRTSRQLTPFELSRVRSCFAARPPWTRPMTSGDEGDQWWLEANDAEGYRRSTERNPAKASPLKRCGALLMGMSGIKFVAVDL